MSESTPAPVEGKLCKGECGALKPLSAFPARSDGRGDGHRSRCRPCENAYRQERLRIPEVKARKKAAAAKRADRTRAYQAEYYQRNREKKLQAAAERRRKNPPDPEQVRAYYKQYYAKNRVRLLAEAAERQRTNPRSRAAYYRAWEARDPEKTREKRRRAMSRRRARLRGLPTEDYTLVQLLARDGTRCVLCGDELDLTARCPDPKSPTVEHLECLSWPTSAGDVLTNVAVAHFRCNTRRRTSPHPAAARKRADLLAAEAAAS